MKSIITIILFVLFSSTVFAQTSAEATGNRSLSNANAAPQPKVEHSQAAVKQLRNHLAQHVEYPAEMINNGIEGTVVVEVKILENGKIQASKIARSLHATLDTAVLKAMTSIKSIAMKKHVYQGVSTVYVPVNFSITH